MKIAVFKIYSILYVFNFTFMLYSGASAVLNDDAIQHLNSTIIIQKRPIGNHIK